MKCEHVQELFPELQENAERFPEARAHLRSCPSCSMLFHIFQNIQDEAEIELPAPRHESNIKNIHKKMRRHDVFVWSRRVTTLAAVMMLAFVSLFEIKPVAADIANVSDEVLFLQSDAAILPEITLDEENMIDYLARYGNLETLGELF